MTLLNSILCLPENKNWNCHLSGQVVSLFWISPGLSCCWVISLLLPPNLDPGFFILSLYAFLLDHITNLYQISAYCFLCQFQPSSCLRLYLELGLHAHDPPVASFPCLSRFLSFQVCILCLDRIGRNTAHVLLHAGFISMLLSLSVVKVEYSIGTILAVTLFLA